MKFLLADTFKDRSEAVTGMLNMVAVTIHQDYMKEHFKLTAEDKMLIAKCFTRIRKLYGGEDDKEVF